MSLVRRVVWFVLLCLAPAAHTRGAALPIVAGVEAQPLLAQAVRLDDALASLGSVLPASDSRRLRAFKPGPHSSRTRHAAC
jgi:hypothetical protein